MAGVWKGWAGTQWKEPSAREEDLAEAGFSLGVAIAMQASHSDVGVVSCLGCCVWGPQVISGLVLTQVRHVAWSQRHCLAWD